MSTITRNRNAKIESIQVKPDSPFVNHFNQLFPDKDCAIQIILRISVLLRHTHIPFPGENILEFSVNSNTYLIYLEFDDSQIFLIDIA